MTEASLLAGHGPRFRADAFGVEFTVFGRAVPQGSKSIRSRRRSNSYPILVASPQHLMTLVNIVDQNHDKLKAWREEIGQVAKILMGGRPLFTGPIFFGVDFYFARPKSHYDKRGVRSGTPKFHTNIPDSSKVLRAVEDALTGVVWTDDKLIAESHQRKLYAEEDRVVVKVMVLT